MTEQEFIDYINAMKEECSKNQYCRYCPFEDNQCFPIREIEPLRVYRECMAWNREQKEKANEQH